jgi:outer membrane immunogenic protein
MRILFTAVLLSTAALSPALAQESAPFTGAHVEALAGYDALGVGDADLDDSADGVLYGVNAGYDFQLGGVIAGIEGEVTDSSTKRRGSELIVVGDSARVNADRDLYVGARLGFAAGPSTMIYAKGGYTNAKLKTEYNNGTGILSTEGVTLDGYRVGAGVEQKFNIFGPSGFVKAEYRYSNYKNLDFGAADIDTDLDRHQLLVGLGVRF